MTIIHVVDLDRSNVLRDKFGAKWHYESIEKYHDFMSPSKDPLPKVILKFAKCNPLTIFRRHKGQAWYKYHYHRNDIFEQGPDSLTPYKDQSSKSLWTDS